MKKIFYFFPLIIIAGAATGQDADYAKAKKLELTTSSSIGSNFLSAFSFTQLTATNDGTNAEAAVRIRMNRGYNLGLDVSTPVSGSGQVKPLTQNGLSNNSSATISLQKVFWGLGFKPNIKTRDSVVANLKKEGKIKGADWNYESLDDASKSRIDASTDWGTALFVGAKIKFDQIGFTYFADTGSGTVKDESKLGINITGTFGMLFNKGNNLSVSYTYINSYSGTDPLTYSIPVNSSGISVQQSISPTPPSQNIDSKFKLEYVSAPINSSFMLDPSISATMSQKVLSANLPIYFLSNVDKDNKKTGLNGGIYISYLTDKDWKFNFNKANYGFGVFIGANIKDLFN